MTKAARHIEFLSENPPGPQMGMGMYERLLIRHLAGQDAAQHWRFGVRFDGRAYGPVGDQASLVPGTEPAGYLGFSTSRLGHVPWPAVDAIMRARLRRGRRNLYHSLALSYPAPGGSPSVVTIHDLAPARFPDEGSLPRWAGRAARQALAIFTPSRFGKEEIAALLRVPDRRVHVVPNGCEHDRFHDGVTPASVDTLARFGIRGSFLVYAGGSTRRKNVRALFEAWASLAPRYPELSLVALGPAAPLVAMAAEVRAPRIVVAGYVPRPFVPAIIKAAVALVCPSVYEGFGLPPLEAMALGVPVVAVRAGAVPEVVGSAALLAEDGSLESIGHAIETLLSDRALARRLAAVGPLQARLFSWEAHAKQVLEVYQQVLGVNRGASTRGIPPCDRAP